MRRCTRMGVAICLAGVFAPASFGGITIDTFDNGSHSLYYDAGPAGSAGPDTATGAWSNNPLGNDRTILLTKLNTTGAELPVSLDVMSASSHTHLYNDPGTSANWSITYGANSDLSINLAGESAFELTFDTVATNLVTQAIISTSGSGSSFSSAYFTPINGILTIDFADFDGGAASLSDVDSIQFLFDSNGTTSRNAFLTQIDAVPEPAAALPGILSLLFALSRRARSR